jgi:hypothetical protein
MDKHKALELLKQANQEIQNNFEIEKIKAALIMMQSIIKSQEMLSSFANQISTLLISLNFTSSSDKQKINNIVAEIKPLATQAVKFYEEAWK